MTSIVKQNGTTDVCIKKSGLKENNSSNNLIMDTKKRRQYTKYDNEEDRIKGYKEAHKRHSEKPWTCEFCNKTMRRSNQVNHERTTAHKRKACPT